MKKSVGIMMCVFLLCTGPLSAAEVKVGSNTPLSGKLSVYGEGFQQAMLLALEEVNAGGGIVTSNKKMLIEVYNVTEQPNFKNIMLLNSLFVEANHNC